MGRVGREDALAALAGGALAVIPAILVHGFTVDDALIPARYATHLARGLGYRFNAAGPITDGVTPLGFPYLLAPFAHAGPLEALAAAKVLGVVAWTIAAATLAVAVRRAGVSRWRYGALLLLTSSVSLAAWSGAGLETGVATALAALAVALPELGQGRAGAAAAGLTAALRPEALPWAMVVGASPPPRAADAFTIGGPERAPDTPRSRRWSVPERTDPASNLSLRTRFSRLVFAGTPFLVVAIVRHAVFGRVVPLSVLAKPSDLAHGSRYALACFVLTGPIAILAPFAWRRLDGWGRGLCVAVFVHYAAIAVAGGDWMPLARLAVPVLPTVLLAAARLAEVAWPAATAARLALALTGEIFQIVTVGPATITGVGAMRGALIEEVRPALAGARVVAALDIGWVGAATDATVVDLAGLTDPDIAVLPGGHTSKAIPTRLLDTRGVDAVVLQVLEGKPLAEPWTDTYFAHMVALRVAETPGIGDEFAVAAETHLPHLHYVVLRRKHSASGGN
jgi:hypothetical protein